MRPELPIMTTDSKARWSERRLALLRQLQAQPQTVNRSWCSRITPGVRPGTPGGDLRRLVREGFAELEHKPGPPQKTRLLPSGERSVRPRNFSAAKRVVLTDKGRELLAQHAPTPPRQANPWSKRRQALAQAGLARAPQKTRPAKGWGW